MLLEALAISCHHLSLLWRIGHLCPCHMPIEEGALEGGQKKNKPLLGLRLMTTGSLETFMPGSQSIRTLPPAHGDITPPSCGGPSTYRHPKQTLLMTSFCLPPIVFYWTSSPRYALGLKAFLLSPHLTEYTGSELTLSLRGNITQCLSFPGPDYVYSNPGSIILLTMRPEIAS